MVASADAELLVLLFGLLDFEVLTSITYITAHDLESSISLL